MYYNLLRCFQSFSFSLAFFLAYGLKTIVRMPIGVFMVCFLFVWWRLSYLFYPKSLYWAPNYRLFCGIMMKTFTGSQIGIILPYFYDLRYYRRILAVCHSGRLGDQREYRRQAVNYCFVLGSFVVGAIISALLMHLSIFGQSWIITLSSLITIMVFTIPLKLKRLGLKETNLL